VPARLVEEMGLNANGNGNGNGSHAAEAKPEKHAPHDEIETDLAVE
jgi:hypothetical protein